MTTYTPKTGEGGRFLGMVLDDGGAWVPLSKVDMIRAEERIRIRRELMAELEPEVRIFRLPGSQTEIECVPTAFLYRAVNRILAQGPDD